MKLSDWYHVSFDEASIRRRAHPPDREPWKDSLRWADIVRVCFKTNGLFMSDEIYLFTNERAESYLVPTEAEGATALLEEIVRRKLFDAGLLIAAAQTNDELFCWPPANEAE